MKDKEQLEIDLLLEKGFEIKTKLFGKDKIWKTQKFTIGRLLRLADIFIKINIDEENFQSENLQVQIAEQYNAVKENASKCAKVMSISVTDNKILQWWLQRHFMAEITPAKLKDFTIQLLTHSDYQNFMTSTILMNGNRPTKAAMVEQLD